MVNYSGSVLDATFAALADPTRRAILTRLARGEATVTELAQPFDMSLPAISKHVRVLESAGLLSRSIEGRVHRIGLKARPLREAARWISEYREFWEERLDALARYVEGDLAKKENPWPHPQPRPPRRSASNAPSRPRSKTSSRPGRKPRS